MNEMVLRFTPAEVTALYQAACGYRVRVPGKKESLRSALSKLVAAGLDRNLGGELPSLEREDQL